jgi:hypothetical protein
MRKYHASKHSPSLVLEKGAPVPPAEENPHYWAVEGARAMLALCVGVKAK